MLEACSQREALRDAEADLKDMGCAQVLGSRCKNTGGKVSLSIWSARVFVLKCTWTKEVNLCGKTLRGARFNART